MTEDYKDRGLQLDRGLQGQGTTRTGDYKDRGLQGQGTTKTGDYKDRTGQNRGLHTLANNEWIWRPGHLALKYRAFKDESPVQIC